MPQNPIAHTVGFANAEANGALVQHLHGRGYRNNAFIGGTSNRGTRGVDRGLGYVDAVRKLKLPAGRVISFGQPPISMAQGGEAIGLLAIDCIGIGRAAGELLLKANDAPRNGERLQSETVRTPFQIAQREST